MRVMDLFEHLKQQGRALEQTCSMLLKETRAAELTLETVRLRLDGRQKRSASYSLQSGVVFCERYDHMYVIVLVIIKL